MELINREMKSYIKDFYKALNMRNKIDISEKMWRHGFMSETDYNNYILLLGKELCIQPTILSNEYNRPDPNVLRRVKMIALILACVFAKLIINLYICKILFKVIFTLSVWSLIFYIGGLLL